MATNINGDTGIDKIQPGTVEASDIPDSTITGAKLADGTITHTKIEDDTITGAKLADGTITHTKIADATINADKLNAGGSGSTGQVLETQGDGSMAWIDAASGGGSLKSQSYTTSGTWTNPGSVTSVKVTVIGGGAGGACMGGPGTSNRTGASGPGGAGIAMVTIPTSPVAITVGGGGEGGRVPAPNPGKTGGTSSFGAFVTATGGTGQTGGPATAAAGQAGSFTAPQGRILSGTNTDIIGGALGSIANPGNGGPQTASTFSTTMSRTSSGPDGTYWNPNSIAAGSQGSKSVYAVNNNRGRGGMGGIVIVEWVE